MSDETINRWFSSNTIADSQLQSVINQNNFQGLLEQKA